MKRKSPPISLLAGFLLCVVSISFLPLSLAGGGALRTSTASFVEITYATYLDLDNDGLEDDIITEFTVYSPTGEEDWVKMDFDFYLTLPSGKTFWMTYKAIEYFDVLPVILEWYNVAEEEGDYIFSIDVHLQAVGDDGRITMKITESLEFDPPESKDGGTPLGIIIY